MPRAAAFGVAPPSVLRPRFAQLPERLSAVQLILEKLGSAIVDDFERSQISPRAPKGKLTLIPYTDSVHRAGIR